MERKGTGRVMRYINIVNICYFYLCNSNCFEVKVVNDILR